MDEKTSLLICLGASAAANSSLASSTTIKKLLRPALLLRRSLKPWNWPVKSKAARTWSCAAASKILWAVKSPATHVSVAR